jgi:hypothetical protein
VVFDDLLKGSVVDKQRLPHGVPVSTFGGPGYLVPGPSDLTRDEFGNFWLYLNHPPYSVLKYDKELRYQFALLTPEHLVAHDTDAEGNLYLLHPGNWVSKHDPLGAPLGAWQLPAGRNLGEFASASGLVIDRENGLIYLADEVLGRVQRMTLDMVPVPVPYFAWGWIGREDLAYSQSGKYDPGSMHYQLDGPQQLRLDGAGHLYVSCRHYVSKFDLATGRQVHFGKHPVLGWGGSFTDSVFSASAALDGHWQRHWLAGVDAAGNVYIADRQHPLSVNSRLQVFSAQGELLQCLDLEDDLWDDQGRRVYIGKTMGLATEGTRVWLVDAGGRVYAGPVSGGLKSGGGLFLGPGAAGRQFDLSRVDEGKLKVEQQGQRIRHRSEGDVAAQPAAGQGTGNCERERRPLLRDGEASLWTPARLGEPFRVTLFDDAGREVPSADYLIDYEDEAGLFGTLYDYFRVTNRSGKDWRNVRFVAEAVE